MWATCDCHTNEVLIMRVREQKGGAGEDKWQGTMVGKWDSPELGHTSERMFLPFPQLIDSVRGHPDQGHTGNRLALWPKFSGLRWEQRSPTLLYLPFRNSLLRVGVSAFCTCRNSVMSMDEDSHCSKLQRQIWPTGGSPGLQLETRRLQTSSLLPKPDGQGGAF